MDIIAHTFIAWIEQHQAWLPLIMVVFATAENLAFLSILIPSTAILVAVGALAAAENINFTPLWIAAAIGSVIGSTISYWLGLRYGDAMLRMRPLRDHPEMVEKSRAAFVKYGPVTVTIGHFLTFLRPVVFLMAGMSRMTLARFMFWNTLGSVAWAWLIPKLGQFGGDIVGWLWAHLF